MIITIEEKQLLQQAILLLQKIYLQIDLSEQEESFLARANKIIMDQNSPSFNDGLFGTRIIEFTDKEISKMPKEYRKTFRTGKVTAHVRKRANGSYEIRCQINGRQISASSKDLATAKARFIEKLHGSEKPPMAVTEQQAAPPAPPVTLAAYMGAWLEIFKKPTVKEISYHQYLMHFNTQIRPVLGERPMCDIKAIEIQQFVNDLVADGKHRSAKQCCSLLRQVFENAVIDDIITKSPMLKVKLPHFEAEEGIPFTREEERKLVGLLKSNGNIIIQAYVFMLYTGLRRSELASIEIKDGWIYIISAKSRKGYKEKTRSVPISPMLEPLLPLINIEEIKQIKIQSITDTIKKYFHNHHTHELRHTFITRCRECNIRREIVSLWAGHAADSSITTAVYTHLETNKDIQEEEIKKFFYPL